MPKKQNKEPIPGLIKKGQELISSCSAINRDYVDDILKTIPSEPIKVITGFRRAGKSTIVKTLCQKLIKNNRYKLENILYLNFEDIELESFNTGTKLKQISDYFLNNSLKDKKLLIFDEIQLIKNWNKLIRTIYEFNNDIEIIITGSNSSLLSSELSSNLAGRFIEFNVQSFSFDEFLLYHKHPKSRANKYFEEFSKFGGLPEIFSINSIDAKFSYLQGIISKVILDDIVQRFNIRNSIVIEKILNYTLLNIGNPISFSRIQSYLKNLGFDIKADTIVSYVAYLKKAFAIFELPKIDWKTRKVFSTAKKYYASDPALAYFYNDMGDYFTSNRLENIVYLKLRRDKKFSSLYYGEDQGEIDFIELDRQNKLVNKYQVTYELNNENIEREIFSLINSAPYTPEANNYLLSLKDKDKDLEFKEPGRTIIVKQRNLINWLLL